MRRRLDSQCARSQVGPLTSSDDDDDDDELQDVRDYQARVLDRARIPDFRPTAKGQALKHRYRCSKAVGVPSVQH